MKHLYTARTFIVLFLIFVAQVASAQTTIGRQKVDAYPTDPWHTTYALTWLPTDYNNNSAKKYPLLIFLHGKGETGNGPSGLYSLTSTGLPQIIANGWNPEAVNPVDGKNYKFIVVSPQANTASNWSLDWTQLKTILPQILERYNVDEDRVYVTGLSAGGQGTWSCVTNGPAAAKNFAAIVPVSSANAVPPDSIPLVGGKYGVKLWQICGDQDAFWGFVTQSTRLYNSGNPKKQAIATPMVGVGHWGWNTAYDANWRSNENKMNIYEWMLQFTNSDKGPGNSNPGKGPKDDEPGKGPKDDDEADPDATPGPDITLTLPANSAQLSVNSQKGSTYKWSQVSGPDKANFSDRKIANPIVTGLVAGTYVFRVAVKNKKGSAKDDDLADAQVDGPDDNDGKTSADVRVNVNAPVVITPVGYASLPGKLQAENFAGMNGVQTESTSDEGGGQNVGWIDQNDWLDYNINPSVTGNYTLSFRLATPSSSAQFQVRRADGSVLATVNINNSWGYQSWQTQSVKVALTAGKQTIRLVSTASPIWNINWIDFALVPNQAPVASAGNDVTITLPTNSANLNGSATDADGTISSYAWTKTSGPAATISTPSQAQTTISNLTAGTYTFELKVTDNNGAVATDEVKLTVNPAPAPPPPPATPNPPASRVNLPGKIEAENFSAMSGVQTEMTLDAGGGQNVGWIDNGDWMDYNVKSNGTGSYNVNLRVATPNSGSQFQIRTQDGTVLATVNVPMTGGYQNWQNVSTTITIPTGEQTLRIVSLNSNIWNINWIDFSPASNAGNGNGNNTPASGRIEAESYKTMSGVQTEMTLDAGGGLDVGWIDQNDWMEYVVTAPSDGMYVLNLRIATPNNGAQLQIRKADGTVVGTLSVPNTGGYQNWQTAATKISLEKGSQNIRIVSVAAPIFNINWLELVPGAAAPSLTRIEAENYSNMSGVQKESTMDAGGGQDVGWIDQNDWMDFTIDAPSAGNYPISLRLATPNNGAQLQIRKADGSILAFVAIPNTGGYQTWQTVNTTVALSAGPQTIRVISIASPIWNFNWMELAAGNGNTGNTPAGSSSVRIEAENYSNMAGIQKEVCLDNGNGQDVGWIDNNDWMDYSVNLSTAGFYTVSFRVATEMSNGKFDLKRADGSVITTVNVPNTNGYQSWKTVTATVYLGAGPQTLRVQSTANITWNLNWIEFAPAAATASVRSKSAMLPDAAQPSIEGALGIYPNPVRDQFMLQVNNAYTGKLTVQIYSLTGVLVKQYNLNKNNEGLVQLPIQAGNLTKGSYVMMVRMDHWNESKQLLKQ